MNPGTDDLLLNCRGINKPWKNFFVSKPLPVFHSITDVIGGGGRMTLNNSLLMRQVRTVSAVKW